MPRAAEPALQPIAIPARLAATLVAVAWAAAAPPASAAECLAPKPRDALGPAELRTFYDCIGEELAKGWARQKHPVAVAHRGWTQAAAYPSDESGAHGGRFLITWVNKTARAAYLAFAESGVAMPVGSILANESFDIQPGGANQGKAIPGPLFIMQKVAKGRFEETGDWRYAVVTPAGSVWIDSETAGAELIKRTCHDCHGAAEGRDAMQYPVVDARRPAR